MQNSLTEKNMRPAIIAVIITLFSVLRVQAQQPDLRLPFPDGFRSQCTQGNGGSTSHNIGQTLHALDLDDQPGTPGRVVVAAAPGTAYIRQLQGDWGNNVRIDHGNGYYTLYAHLASFNVSHGQANIKAGDQIGIMGNTGLGAPAGQQVHLHFSLHQGNANTTLVANTVRADRIWARDDTGGGSFRWFRSDEFQGDLSIPPGKVYEAGTPTSPPATPSTPVPQIGINADGRLEVLVRRDNGSIEHVWQISPSGPWAGWDTFGGDVTGNPIVGRNIDGRLEFFVRGHNQSIYNRSQLTPNGSWSNWNELPGVLRSDPTVGINSDGRLEIFAIGTNSQLYHRWQMSPGGGWSGWDGLGGSITQDPFAASNADGRLEVFAIGTDDSLHHIYQRSLNGNWSTWDSLGGGLAGKPIVGRNADGRLEVFMRGGNGAIYHKWQTAPNGSWSNWDHLYDLSPFASNPATATDGDNWLHVFVRGLDDAIYWTGQPPGGWRSWSSLGGVVTSDPAAARMADGRLLLVARGTNSVLYQQWQRWLAGPWSGWRVLDSDNPPLPDDPVSGFSISPTTVKSGQSATGTVTLLGRAPLGGLSVPLSNTNPGAVSIPGDVVVAGGQTMGTFTITSRAVSIQQTATLTATSGGASRQADITVTPVILSSLTLSPSSVRGGTNSIGTVTLDGPAPAGGYSVQLSSSDTSIATVPQTVLVSENATSASFSVQTSIRNSATQVTILAELNGVESDSVLSVEPSYALAAYPSSATPGERITINWTAPVGSSAKDWIGLYRAGASDSAYLWFVHTGGATSGTTSFIAESQGTFEFRYFINNGLSRQAVSNQVVVAVPTGLSLTASPTVVNPGANVTVTFTAPSGRPSVDWIGLFRVGTDNRQYLWYAYANGATSGSFVVPAPTQPGEYEFRYLANNGWADLARSNRFSVNSANYTLQVSPLTVAPGGSVTINWTAPSGSSNTDWIGLYREGESENRNYLWSHWFHTNGASSGNKTVSMPAQTGRYVLRYLLNNGYTHRAESAVIEVR